MNGTANAVQREFSTSASTWVAKFADRRHAETALALKDDDDFFDSFV